MGSVAIMGRVIGQTNWSRRVIYGTVYARITAENMLA